MSSSVLARWYRAPLFTRMFPACSNLAALWARGLGRHTHLRVLRACSAGIALGLTASPLCAQVPTVLEGEWRGDCFALRLRDSVGIATRTCAPDAYRVGDTIVRVRFVKGAAFVGTMFRLDKRALLPISASQHGLDWIQFGFTSPKVVSTHGAHPRQSLHPHEVTSGRLRFQRRTPKEVQPSRLT